ncbi:hypothetical protein KDJ56_05825 [Brevibacillus composti]|uniref:Uncharacterized protein n=1 Tax=Brevibacillus composti TaxID=2796470 RepID=A0A7T5EMV5_9BACL|nr:hypothetical protein [Brevibacillus composti]QQE75487.1 hypothetical protein JD108_06145 [Brevibacillus composti]QUO42513.1 hypothetical protein KDJ56_05825 [Brevibacillus composti]
MHIGYLTIGIILGLAGFGMLLYAMATSPAIRKRDKYLKQRAAEHHQPPHDSRE